MLLIEKFYLLCEEMALYEVFQKYYNEEFFVILLN